MKRFSWKYALATFCGLLAIDIVLGFLLLVGTDYEWCDWVFGTPFWIINFPGYPIWSHLSEIDNASLGMIVLQLLSVWVLSASIWSGLTGWILGRRWANKVLHATAAPPGS